MGLRIVEKAALSDVGRQRQGNEDSFLERAPLFVVADGMGGARAGEVASKMAVEQFDQGDGSDSPPEQLLAHTAKEANRKIHEMAQRDSSYAGMGTTFTAALVSGREIAIGHVGDSRLYRFRDDELERLTHDHSLVEEFVRQGKLTPEEAEVHPQRSIITRALGPEPDVEVDTYTFSGRDGDVYLLNSDGLTGMISEDQVAEILRNRESLEDAAEKLIAAANENGGKDNITVVLFRLEADGDDGDSGDTLGGQETQAGVSAETVRAEVAKADAAESAAPRAATKPATKTIPSPRDTDSHMAAPPVALQRARSRRRRGRRSITGAIVIVVIAAVVAGLYALDRKFWFVGTDGRGQVTLYRGLPYDLPFGVALYSQQYESGVPVAAVTDAQQREFVLDHHPRSQGESVALMHDIERKYVRP